MSYQLTASSSDSRYSYGWHRAEIIAALINGVFLLALCFSISLEAIQRFFSTPEISNPKLIVVVGSFGLASNILGLFLIHEHGHSHNHSRTIRAPSSSEFITDETSLQAEFSSLSDHPAAVRASVVQQAQEISLARSPITSLPRNSIDGDSENFFQNSHSGPFFDSALEDELSRRTLSAEHTPLLQEHSDTGHGQNHSHSHGSMNMRALILHVMGDALGNVGVISTGLVIWLTQWNFKYYFDPIISLVITVIIVSSALPLVRSASFILLQTVPTTISLDGVRDAILGVDGVLSVHELHIWQLSESKVIASVHVLTSPNHDFMPIAVEIRKVLHHHGIHSSTIQPEYVCPGTEYAGGKAKTSCLVLCPSDQVCDPVENACCPPPVHTM
ncbi:hypothetical protein H2248_003849 [Termitomyces sp. 'cryptogamus']|nr:hypothetical protein H2248_003849 [Termitomyces sp. 'cryptogamus']